MWQNFCKETIDLIETKRKAGISDDEILNEVMRKFEKAAGKKDESSKASESASEEK